ncbi:phage tail protein [Labrys portucalensis]|uniref:Phage tail protein n=1 Tax=Labrys neptuniae TaxID=376174 RepID=A0ABV6ZJY6_9HYPH
MSETLLPDNATPLELAFSATTNETDRLGPVFEQVPIYDFTPPPRMLPWLVWQYGLGELSPYLPNLYDLIAEGVRWQRIRGTHASIFMGLGWLGYSGRIEEEPTWRRRWNRFQVELDRVRDRDLPDLQRIDGIVSLSPPVRSIFSRGYAGYDIRAFITSKSRASGAIYSDHSGVTLPSIGAKWSFGRAYDFERQLTEAELTALDAWVPPVPEGGLWVDDDNLWVEEDFLWAVPGIQARRDAITAAVVAYRPWLRFDNAQGDPIGYRRALIHPVAVSATGEYEVAGAKWTTLTSAPTAMILRGRTGFGDGAGQTAASVSIVFGGGPVAGLKSGLLWLAPDQFSGGVALSGTPVSIPFGLTVRERCTFLLTF